VRGKGLEKKIQAGMRIGYRAERHSKVISESKKAMVIRPSYRSIPNSLAIDFNFFSP
jgi:hypothetical protein